ncbi:DUF2927 domain-containing protein [Flagellimonas myxillae]|uniref:DUF2927 domain-containing protein n=1 Tax=Flagellimonas myxillae TaxID=2942214 RepID=UPI00201E774D|nr:DUF2927 domain-containing protein [Muricauda myxillae]MCL6265348.1 DUF2927 domain-containing protein [Muricauda myxillae]
MKSNNRILFILFLILILVSCSKDEEGLSGLSEHEIDVINYFKEVALGFEFGNASKITRKWNSDLRIFVGGNPDTDLLDELDRIKTEINELATDGFQVNIVNDTLQSNYYIFFGTGFEYAEIFPNQSNLVVSNWGLFSVFWNGQDQFTSGHMYVDIVRANTTAQKHLLREELTQSLGLANDSHLYSQSIFQQDWTTTTEYAPIDRDLIRLLYHPEMGIGLNNSQVDTVLREILSNE